MSQVIARQELKPYGSTLAMAQKFIGLDDAAEQLGITKERLNEIRESGDLRAYRDGASWKFRTEEVDGYQVADASGDASASGDADGGLAAESSLELESLDLGLDDTSTEEVSVDEDLVLGVEPLGDGDDAESILLTEDELEGGLPTSPSTIIGRSELSLEDDLQLASSSSADGLKPAASFDDVEELELDLEAESSRILGAQDVAAAQAAAKEGAAPSSDLSLEDEFELDLEASDASVVSGSDPAIAGGSGPGSSGPGSVAGISGLDDIQLGEDEQDDMVLGGSDDFSLSTSDSGINLAPSDSGISLDDVSLDLGGSALGSALDLAALSAASASAASLAEEAAAAASGEDLLLTPIADDEEDGGGGLADLDDLEEEDDVVAFVPEGEEEGEEEDGFSFSEGSALGGDLGMAGASAIGAGVGVAAAAAPTVASSDTTFPTGIMVLLGCSLLTMSLCGIMALDLINSMWSWSEPYSVNSTIMDGILGLFGG